VPGPHVVATYVPSNAQGSPVTEVDGFTGASTSFKIFVNAAPMAPGTVNGTITIGGNPSFTYVDDGSGNLVFTTIGSPAVTITGGTVDYYNGVVLITTSAPPGPIQFTVTNTQLITSNSGDHTNLVLNGINDKLDVVFDRDMDPTSFTPADILRIVGPAGPIPL